MVGLFLVCFLGVFCNFFVFFKIVLTSSLRTITNSFYFELEKCRSNFIIPYAFSKLKNEISSTNKFMLT